MEAKETVREMARPEGRVALGDRSPEWIAAGNNETLHKTGAISVATVMGHDMLGLGVDVCR